MPERKKMHISAGRRTARTIRTFGARTRVVPKRMKPENQDLRVFRLMSKISRRVTAEEIDELIGPV
jgi:uroporphyrinogen-III synthase